MTSPSLAPVVLHETSTRLRLRCPLEVDLAAAEAQLSSLPGIHRVRRSAPIRSLSVTYDGRRATRTALMRLLGHLAAHSDFVAPGPRARRTPDRRGSVLAPALTAAAIPLLPRLLQVPAALALVGLRAAARSPTELKSAAFLLDTVSLGATALAGHPFTTATSVLLGAAGESWRNQLVQEADQLLAHLAPGLDESYPAHRGEQEVNLQPDALRAGDVLPLSAGQVVPADGIVIEGECDLRPLHPSSEDGSSANRGQRVASGERVIRGSIRLRVTRRASRSRLERMRGHVRHTIRTRDEANRITPALDRLTALPITAASLILSLTGDTTRSAAMLQADPQRGLLLAQPVAREASLYALARQGLLASGMEAVERLAEATTLAIEDIGIVTQPVWHLESVRVLSRQSSRQQVESWLAALGRVATPEAVKAGFPDAQVKDWLEHGAVIGDGGRTLHIAGPESLRRAWGIELPPARAGLVRRRLGVVDGGRLLGIATLSCQLRDGLEERIAALRRLGFRRIAVFTEDSAAEPPETLQSLGADLVVSAGREAQGRWLDEAVEAGERVVLVHTGLRDLLPPGGLSLCPVEAEAGAHGVLLGDPLSSLASSRALARVIHTRLRLHFGVATVANAALMIASGLRLIPPIATTSLNHAFALFLLRNSMAPARLPQPAGPTAPPSPVMTPMEAT